MVDSNLYVENPANNSMHYGNKPIVGTIDFPDRLPFNRPYNYFEGQALYNSLAQDIWQQEQHADPEKVKKGVPKIIKIALCTLAAIPLVFYCYKGIKIILNKFKH